MDNAGSNQDQQQWNADNRLAMEQQKEGNKAALDCIKQQGVSQKQQHEFEENMARMQYESQNDACALELKV